ncbi:MAG: S1 RNA-binding domain-containing protein [Anaerolineales bacterium]|nr:S1 RNA-binding domain-containing protein [Anaerolineales bacterium]
MVTKRRYNSNGEASEPPPPMDESWWEALMAEDEALSSARPYRTMRRAAPENQYESLYNGSHETDSLDWKRAFELYEQDQVVQLTVTGCNRGGLLVAGDRLHGFVPISHLVETPCPETDAEIWLQKHIDRKINLKIIECDQERGRVVFSERAAQARPGSRKYLLNTLRPGSCVTGVVTNITEFGVFVDLGGVEGLVHVSEISWGRVHHPADVVQLGQEVNVHVIKVEPERARVALSLKRLYPNPWETAEERYLPGQVTEAVITSIVPFGAFARLEEGLDGLIHISEFSALNGSYDPAKMLQEGQRVQVRILHVDAARQRLGLSLKVNETQTS